MENEKAQDAITAAQDAGKPAGEATAQDAGTDLEEKLSKAVRDRRQANAEAQAAKQQLDQALKRLREYEDRDKSEQQRLSEAAEAASKRAEELARKAAEAEMKLSLVEDGVPREMLDYAFFEMSRASAGDGFDRGEWIKEFKKRAPFVFAAKHAVPTGTAGPPPGGAVSDKQAKIDELTKEIARLNQKQSLTHEERARLISLVGERSRLKI